MRKTLIMLAILAAVALLALALWMARGTNTMAVPQPVLLTDEKRAEILQKLMSSTTSASVGTTTSAEIKRQQAILNSLQAPGSTTTSATSTSGSKPSGMSPEEQRKILESLQAK